MLKITISLFFLLIINIATADCKSDDELIDSVIKLRTTNLPMSYDSDTKGISLSEALGFYGDLTPHEVMIVIEIYEIDPLSEPEESLNKKLALYKWRYTAECREKELDKKLEESKRDLERFLLTPRK